MWQYDGRKFYKKGNYAIASDRDTYMAWSVHIYAYSNFYVNKELSYEDLRKKARDAYSKLNDVYRTVVEEWFPLTDSDLKDYSKQSYDLAIDIQELLFLLNSDKGEEWAISNFKLKLIKYYRSMEAWKEATDKLE